MSTKYAKNDGYKRVEAYVAWVMDADEGLSVNWASEVLADKEKLADVIARMLGHVRDSRKNDPEWKGLSARKRWVEAAVVEAIEKLAHREVVPVGTVEWVE